MSFSSRFISNKSCGNLSNFSTPRVSIVHGTKLKGAMGKNFSHYIKHLYKHCSDSLAYYEGFFKSIAQFLP